MKTRRLEICAGSVQSALAAQAGGADRIELGQNLEQGGITPSYGTIQRVLCQLSIPVFVLIRPRPGHFCYDAEEQAIMVADIRQCQELGCAGVVLGALDRAGRPDLTCCRTLMAAAQGMQVTFHRAFDACADQFRALEDVIGLGCQRVLTSGGQRTALAGQKQLAALVQQAGGRICVMPGAGITPAIIPEVAQQTGAHEFHASAKRLVVPGPSAQASEFDTPVWETDAAIVAELMKQLGSCQPGRVLNRGPG